MKFLPFLLFLFITSTNSLEFKAGTYKPVFRKKQYRDTVEQLSLNQDQTFVRDYTVPRMCIGPSKECDIGGWMQLGDTLLLTDTLFYPAPYRPIIKRIFGIDDTAIVRTTTFRIKRKGLLKFIDCKAGKARYHLPDYEFESGKENRKARMIPLF
jgi:hypothetical protein